MTNRTLLAAAASAAAMISLVACQGATPVTPASSSAPSASAAPATGGSTAPAAMTADVSIKNFAFNPATVTIKKGGTVTWTNEDSVQHNAAPTTSGFTKLNLLKQGEKGSATFDTVGSFDYVCEPHKTQMKGKVIVVD